MEQVNKIIQKFQQSKNTLRVAGLLIIAVLVAALYFDVRRTSTMEEYIESYHAYEQQVQTTLRENAILKKTIEDRTERARLDSIKAAQKTTVIARLKDSLAVTQGAKTRLEIEIDNLQQIAPDTSEISLKKDTIITLLRQDSAVMHRTIVQLEERDIIRLDEIALHKQNTADANQRADKAELVLTNLPPAPKNPDKWFFGLLPKPSRTVVAITTAIVSVATTIVVIK